MKENFKEVLQEELNLPEADLTQNENTDAEATAVSLPESEATEAEETQTYPMVAKTFQGLEEVLADELTALGATNVEIGNRMVSFEGDLELMYRANLCCRTALRILKPIIKFTATDPDDLYDQVRDIEWEDFMTPDSTFSIDSTVNSTEFTHSKYVTYRVKDGIADHFSDRYGRRPSIRLKGADVQLNVHINEDRVTISLDSSGEPLSKRGYRVEATEAPINEALAAGIILKTGWKGDTDFVDPMCGSGTFLIEAALIASNTPPGIFRSEFAFEKWPDFDKELFESIYNDDSAEVTPSHRIMGGDIDPEAVLTARRNIKSARLDDMIEISCRSMGDWTENDPEGTIVTNPPYGERLKPAAIEGLYSDIGKWLKENFEGWDAWILGYQDEHFAAVRLKPTVKYPILNGALEYSLRQYRMFSGRYDDFRSAGGSLGKEDLEENTNHVARTRHLSDKEWKRESRKFSAPKSDRRDSRDGFKSDRNAKSDRGGYKSDRGGYKSDRDFGGKDRKYGDKDRKFGGKDRGFGDKDRKFGGKDRGFGSKGPRKMRDHEDERGYGRDRRDTRKPTDRPSRRFDDDAMSYSEAPARKRKGWK